MQLFAITRPGLIGIAASVLALWGCIAAEKTIRRTADKDLITAQRQLRRLRESNVPVSYPTGVVTKKPVSL